MGTTAALWAMAIGSLASAGASAYSGHKSSSEAKKARDQARAQYEREQAAITKEKERLKNLEAEKKRRITKGKSEVPGSVLTGGSFTGIQDPATTQRAKLLGQ